MWKRVAQQSVLLPLSLLAVLLGCTNDSDIGWPPPGTGGRPSGPNVILISLDTLRADRLGAYGYGRPTSPALDRLAAESVLFETALSQSAYTLVSHKSIFAAKYPLHLAQEVTNVDMAKLRSVKDPRQFLESTFRQARVPLTRGILEQGYRSAAFTDGVWLSREMGFDEGFETFDDAGGHLARIVPKALRWLGSLGGAPFFLFLHTYDTHAPYYTREPFNSRFCSDHTEHLELAKRCNQIDCGLPPLMKIDLGERDLRAISDHYDGKVARMDAHLGLFLDRLRQLQLYDETLIVVISDHGESLGEHAQVGHGGLYLEQLRVPFIVKFPRSWKVEPTTLREPVVMVDVMPTIYAVCGLEAPTNLDGRSLLPLIRGGDRPHRYLLAQTSHDEGRDATTNPMKRALIDPGRWYLIHDALNGALELFDLRTDRLALTDVSGSAPPELPQLLAALATTDVGQSDAEFLIPEVEEMSEELKARLRALGYLGD